MHTVISRTAKITFPVISMVSRPAVRRITCLVITLASGFTLLSGNLVTRKVESRARVAVHAAGRAKGFFNFQDGRQMFATFRGAAAQALQSGQAQGRALASADLDGNGTPDIVAGYSYGGTGIVTIQRGNPEAYAPTDTSVFERMQNGYNPEALLPEVETITTPEAADFVQLGDFNGDNRSDIVVGARRGDLFLLANDGKGGFLPAQQIQLPGSVTALTAGEFRAADGKLDIAVGVNGPGGTELLIYDGAQGGLTGTPMQFPLTGEASVIRFDGMDDDPFIDAVVASDSDVLIVHGWGRKASPALNSRVERVSTPSEIHGLAVGNFSWNREGRPDIAALAADGSVRLIQGKGVNTTPFTEAELAARSARGRVQAPKSEQERFIDVETVGSWNGSGRKAGWAISETVATTATPKSGNPDSALTKTNLLSRETEEIILTSINELKVLRHGVNLSGTLKNSGMTAAPGEMAQISLPSETSPVAVLQLPQKLNGERDLIMLQDGSSTVSVVPNAPNTTITVDRTDDPSGASLTAASACTAAGSDCSLRGAIQFANNPANNNTTINIPAGTYTLAINGAGGCVSAGEAATGNTVGDLEINQTTTIVGASSASTIIRQHGVGAANAGDRVMCLNAGFALNLNYSFTGITVMGGRESNTIGGAGIIGGEKGNTLTLTDVTLTNNQVINGNLGGGGISITGGNVTITNSLIGGTSAPQATFDPSILANRDTVANANKNNTSSGGGVYFTPSAPTHSASTGNLVVTGTTFNHNVVGNNGGGAELEIFNVGAGAGTGSAKFDTSTFTNNQVTNGNGGGIAVASLPTILGSIAGTLSFTSNSAFQDGGAVHQGGSTLTIDGTTATINFASNNTAPFGSSVSINAGASLSGTQTTIGGDFAVLTNGIFTANAGSAMSPQNFKILGGTATLNNSTINTTGDFVIGIESSKAGILNANSATINIQGNLNVDLTPTGPAAAGQFNAGTSTFNFNGTGAQSASNVGPGTPITFFNLTDSNITQPLTISNNINVSNTLNVNGANAILNPAAAVIIGGTGTLTGTGTARATRIVATADFLNQYTITNKTLTNLTIDYNGAGNQTVNNAPAYSSLIISGTGTKTLQGNTVITRNLNIAAATLATNNFNFALGGNWTNSSIFTAGTGTVTFQGASGTQTLSGNTTFFNLTLNNTGATTDFGNTTTTIGNDLVTSAGTMAGGTSTIIFTGVTDNLGSISGAQAKNFHNLQINSPATISNTTGGAINILNDYTNTGTFTQTSGQSTNFVSGPDGIHAMSGAGTTTFGVFTINTANTVNAGSHNFNVVGATFNVNGTGVFNGGTGTVTFNAGAGQGIAGDGAKNFNNLTINNPGFLVNVLNGTGTPDASVGGVLTLTTDLSVAAGGILQQSGTSAGAADVIGTVRRTDLGVTARSFGNVNNSIQINSGTPPTQMDFNLAKNTPAGPPAFPATVNVVPRDITLTSTGGSGISATVKMRYIDPAELATVTEARLILWKNVGGTTWTPQGGAVDTTNNFVSLAGVSSFSEWAIAEGSDLTLNKANNVSNAAVTGQAWNWTLTAANTGAPATFTAGQTIITDNLPNSNINYGTPTVQNVSNITGSANISCAILSNDLTCTANGGSVTFASNIGASSFDVVFSATPQVVASFVNPRGGGGIAQIDPNGAIAESNDTNNNATTNTVTVSKASTTTTITNSVALGTATVVGQPYAVNWSVTVNAPGSVGAALTGNVTVSDGSQTCVAAVSALTCNLTSTTPGAPKNITATYAGDTNYNGSASSPATPHTVNKANTTTTITEDNPDPSNTSQSVTVKWTVTVDSPGAGTPTGNVNVTVSGGAETCSAAVGAGQCSLTLTTTGTRTITATYVGDTNFNTSNDTETHDVINVVANVNDAKVPEPPSGTTNMLFTVTLSNPAAAGGASVNYATANGGGSPATGGAACDGTTVDYINASGTLSFAAGEQIKTIPVTVCADNNGAEPDETFLLNLSTPVNCVINDGQATGTITAVATAGTLLISELRTSGSGGPGDDFVELYNNTNSPLTVTASDASGGYGVYKMGADCNAAPVLIGTIPNGTIIPARGHYLMVGSQYSLANYGGTGAAAGNLTMSPDIENDRNVAVFTTANVLNISSANLLDAVGFGTNTGNVCALMLEGTTAPPVSGTTADHSFFRTETTTSGGNPKDTNNNAADFKFADPQGTFISGVTQALGAPGPENLASPLRRDTSGIGVLLLDTSVSSSSFPNRFRDFTAVTNGTFGTLTVRRRVPNTTGGNVTRLRFRIVDITTFPSPGGGVADLRALTSVDEVSVGPVGDAATCLAGTGSSTTPCTVPTKGLTLETPPAQLNGGGYNSTLSAGTVTLGTPLANNSSILVNFKLGVQTTGTFRFLIIVEALP